MTQCRVGFCAAATARAIAAKRNNRAMPFSKVLTLLSLAASAVAASQKAGAFKLEGVLKRKVAKASKKPSLKPRKLVETAHPILKAAFAAKGTLTGADFAAAAAAGGAVPVDRAAALPPRAAVSRLGGFATDAPSDDCSRGAAHSSTTFCYGMDGYVATDPTNSIDEEWLLGAGAPPAACTQCGFFHDDDEHRAEFASRTDYLDCVACGEGDVLMVFYEDCTGACVNPSTKAYFEAVGFADLAASACLAFEPCGYEGISLEGTVPPLAEAEDEDEDENPAAEACAAQIAAVEECWHAQHADHDEDEDSSSSEEDEDEDEEHEDEDEEDPSFASCDDAQASEHWAHACAEHAETACGDLFQAYHECEWEFYLANHEGLDCDMTCAGVAAPEEHHDDHDGHDHGDAMPEESDGAVKIGAAAASAFAAAFALL